MGSSGDKFIHEIDQLEKLVSDGAALRVPKSDFQERPLACALVRGENTLLEPAIDFAEKNGYESVQFVIAVGVPNLDRGTKRKRKTLYEFFGIDNYLWLKDMATTPEISDFRVYVIPQGYTPLGRKDFVEETLEQMRTNKVQKFELGARYRPVARPVV